jgi:RNA polymerase sigma factor (TIGR02999 family)
MSDNASGEVTRILQEIRRRPGESREATDRLFAILYDELHKIAESLMRGERHGHTLQPTALVNEAYLKLLGATDQNWENRAHFLRTGARAMRQVLVDYARKRAAAKRGGEFTRVTLHDNFAGGRRPEIEILALHEILNRLSALDERMGRVVEMRVFAGMKMAEIAHTLSVSKRTADNDWSFARRWLSREIGGQIR